jgi:putative copper resistance protein D
VPDTLSVVLRAVSFVLLLQAAGIAIFCLLLGKLAQSTAAAARRLGLGLAVAAIVFVAGHFFLEAARMAGDMSGAWDSSMQLMALRSSMGAAAACRVGGLLLLCVGLRKDGTGSSAGSSLIGVFGAALAVCGFTLTGHTSDNPHRLAAAALLLIHLLVVAFWIGSLWPLYAATSRETPATAGRLIDTFSSVATWVVPAILVAGLALIWILVPGLATFSQPYGRLLLVKLALFAVLMALAALNKWRYGPGVGRGEAVAVRSFRRTVAIEYALICAVLAVTAVMTTFYSPEPA